uniref:SKI like proto-onco n=1 Tax=Latimeria chalumnae TaxID=7897 RepID=H3B477_LATCH
LRNTSKHIPVTEKYENKKMNGVRNEAPIKKRIMTETQLSGRMQDRVRKSPKIKNEQVEDCGANNFEPEEEDTKSSLISGTGPLDLNPGLKHTLAQFHLSSQSSLGGPAAFSTRYAQENMPPSVFLPLRSPPILSGPLLIPSDSSTELTQTLLEGEAISCFMVGGEKRLCLPQVLNSVLRDFSLQQINTVCDELYIYCSRCTADQLQILKVLGILPLNAPSCGLITLTDAQRLCNALLRPRITVQSDSMFSNKNSLVRLKKSGTTFEVEHECLGKCQGLFVLQFYIHPDAPCIQCLECCVMFSPQKFVMHSHRLPDKRTCHWGFDSAKWPCYLHLSRKYADKPDEKRLKRLLEELKEKLNFCNQQKRTHPKVDSQQSFAFHQWFPIIKQEADHINQPPSSLVHPSYYLHMYDKVVAPNVSLTSSVPQCKDATKVTTNRESIGRSQKQQNSRKTTSFSEASLEEEQKAEATTDQNNGLGLHISSSSADQVKSERDSLDDEMETSCSERNRNAQVLHSSVIKDISSEDDKDRIIEEVIKMYMKQQEKLNATLQENKQLQLEIELLRRCKTPQELSLEHHNLQKELEYIQSDHAQKMEEFSEEQMELKKHLEQLMKQNYRSRPPLEKETEYSAQLAELRQRLDRTEADRQGLQDELSYEREAREKLEVIIKDLKLQISKSLKNEKDNRETASVEN